MRQIMASEMPVLPDVGSRTMRSFVSTPRRSASSIMYLAMRSLTLPLGFWPSSLAKRRTDALGLIRGISTSGVLPMASMRFGVSALGYPPARAGRMLIESPSLTRVLSWSR